MRLRFYFASHLYVFVRQFYGVDAEGVGEAVTTDPGVSLLALSQYVLVRSSMFACNAYLVAI